MKQQQESAGFLKSKIINSCRFCDADTNIRENLKRNTIFHDRFHFQIMRFREKKFKLSKITKKKKFFIKHDLILKFFFSSS